MNPFCLLKPKSCLQAAIATRGSGQCLYNIYLQYNMIYGQYEPTCKVLQHRQQLRLVTSCNILNRISQWNRFTAAPKVLALKKFLLRLSFFSSALSRPKRKSWMANNITLKKINVMSLKCAFFLVRFNWVLLELLDGCLELQSAFF